MDRGIKVKRSERGEMIVESLVSVLIVALSSAMLMQAVVSASAIN